MDWDRYRRDDYTIDLVKAFKVIYGDDKAINHERAQSYLGMVEQLQPVRSRQTAAVAIAGAGEIFREPSW